MIEKIKFWWRFEARWYLRDIRIGIRNLRRWFTVIWRDRDWDPHFIYEIMARKLEQQAYHIADNDRHVSAARDAEKMLLCARLIRIQQEEMYRIEYLDYYKETHEMIPTDETKKWYTVESTPVEDRLSEYFAKYPRQHQRVLSGEINWFGRPAAKDKSPHEIALEIGLENQERSRQLLFKIFADNIESWWN